LSSLPKLWSKTIEAHRREVNGAILDTAAALVAEHGLAAVTMSQIAEAAGISRATLYKYFPDVEAILIAGHERRVERHLDQLARARDRSGDPGQRVEAVLEAYALMLHERSEGHARSEHAGHPHPGTHGGPSRGPGGGEIAAIVHRGEHVARAERRLTEFMADVLREGAKTGNVRDDLSAEELARYCLYALTAAAGLSSKPAIRRLVAVTLSGMRPQR
jgi:AcrR family transcriptional regulator